MFKQIACKLGFGRNFRLEEKSAAYYLTDVSFTGEGIVFTTSEIAYDISTTFCGCGKHTSISRSDVSVTHTYGQGMVSRETLRALLPVSDLQAKGSGNRSQRIGQLIDYITGTTENFSDAAKAFCERAVPYQQLTTDFSMLPSPQVGGSRRQKIERAFQAFAKITGDDKIKSDHALVAETHKRLCLAVKDAIENYLG